MSESRGLDIGGPRPRSQTGLVTWPNNWTVPSYPQSNTWTYSVPATPTNEYANEVEVEQGKHDATLRFYRTKDSGKALVKEITIPLGLLEWLQAK